MAMHAKSCLIYSGRVESDWNNNMRKVHASSGDSQLKTAVNIQFPQGSKLYTYGDNSNSSDGVL